MKQAIVKKGRFFLIKTPFLAIFMPIIKYIYHFSVLTNIRLYEVKARMGKTNAQNEAQKNGSNIVSCDDGCEFNDG